MRAIKPYFTNQELLDNYKCEIPTMLLPTNLNTKMVGKSPDTMLLSEKLGLEKQNHDFDNKIYGLAKPVLEIIFKKKCAFCEANISSGAAYDVEHFRPKKSTKNATHKGYYWLGYEWTNFLLSCQKCNREYKKTLFPVNGTKATAPSKINFNASENRIQSNNLLEEESLLLHPCLDNPADNLYFTSNGNIKHKTSKGEKSIEIYGLKRKELVESRQKIVKRYQRRIVGKYEDATSLTISVLKDRIKLILLELYIDFIEKIEEFIAFREQCLNQFEAFIIDAPINGVEMPNREILRSIYWEIKEEFDFL